MCFLFNVRYLNIFFVFDIHFLLPAIGLTPGGSSTVEYSTVQYSTVEYSTVNTVQYSKVQYSKVNTVQYTFTHKH